MDNLLTGDEMMLNEIRAVFKGDKDVAFHELCVHQDRERTAWLVFIEGLVNADMIDAYLLRPLAQADPLGPASDEELVERILCGGVYHCSCKAKASVGEVTSDILAGNAALVIDGLEDCIVFEVKGYAMRSVAEPSSENVVKGARDCFIEALRVNTATIRRRIQSSDLRIAEIPVGTAVQTKVAAVYMEDTADPVMVQDVLRRLQRIEIAQVKSPGNIEEHIADQRYGIFPQTVFTERPDRLCANVLEGKVGILIDGYPTAYVVPIVFNMLFHTAEDYAFNYLQYSIVRALRFLCAFLSLTLPAFYVSILTFHQELLPTTLLTSIIKSKMSVPFSTLLEVLALLVAFEILVEAGVRLPNAIGQAVSIVGGLVVGEAAVSARFISPAVVVVVAVTGICGFIIPNHYLSNIFRLLRIALTVMAGLFGLYGLSMSLILLLYHLCSMTSMNMPYMAPTYPPSPQGAIRDGFFRLPVRTKGAGDPK